MKLQEVGCGYMDWMGLAQDSDRWRTLVSAVMNLRVPWNAGNFLTSCKPVSFSIRILHHGISNYYTTWVYICSLRYPACNAHAPYCHLYSVWLYYIFFHFPTNCMIFGTTLLNKKCVFVFATSPESFLILRRIHRYRLNIQVPSSKVHVNTLILSDVVELEFYRWIFEKNSNKISWKSVYWQPSCSTLTGGQTWRS